MFRYSGFHDLNSEWQARANLAWVSDSRYVEDFSNSLYGVFGHFAGQHARPLRTRPLLDAPARWPTSGSCRTTR